MSSGTAIVIGATGLVGRSLVEALLAAPHVDEIVTLTRRPAPHPSPRVHNHVVDFDDMATLAPFLTGGSLFSALGTTRKIAGSEEAQRRVDLDYQLAAAEVAARNGVKHYLLVSSGFADRRSKTPYLRMKGELEEAVAGLDFERVSIFQPFILVGGRDKARPLEQLGAGASRWLSRIPGLRRFRPISGAEVAAKMARVSARPGPPREWFRLDQMFDD